MSPSQNGVHKDDLQSLGRDVKISESYNPGVLETFENRNPDRDFWVSFQCPEFTSVCPVTGQPDFARIEINYIPAKRMVESKSLKLYLFSFRNHGAFHESCVNMILDDLFDLMKPKYIEVEGVFTPRGGIAIYPFASRSVDEPFYNELRETRFANRQSPKLGLMPMR